MSDVIAVFLCLLLIGYILVAVGVGLTWPFWVFLQ